MEMTSRHGGRGPSWSYRRLEKTGSSTSYTTSSSRSDSRVLLESWQSKALKIIHHVLSWNYRRRHEEIGSSSYTVSRNSSSSRSGTIVSSAYTSGVSRQSSGFSMEAALELDLESELRLGTPDKKDAEFAHIRSLVQEFFHGPSENRSILGGGGGGMSALKRWFSELGVSWVLQIDVGCVCVGVAALPRRNRVGIWIQALTQIMETIHLTECFFADHGHGFVGMPGISEQEVGSGKQAATSLDPVQFALFFQEAMAKMLVFVDVMFSKSISILEPRQISSVPSNSCFDVHRALSEVLSGIRLQFHWSPPAEVEKIEKEMVSLLSAKQRKVFDAIWSSTEGIRTRLLKSVEDLIGADTPQGSSEILQATWSVTDHMIKFLLHNIWEVDPLFVSQAASLGKYWPQAGLEEAQSFISMIAEMVSCLEEKLITKSQPFPDKGLALLFLLNNSNFIRKQLLPSFKVDVAAVTSLITCKVEHYTESYIQVSWEPMLACLSNHTTLRLVRKYSPLSKFESEFQKTYTTQKLWKVPDPGLRKRLRRAVIEKIIPGYTKYIEDSKVTNPKFTPQELEEMLQELFEG